VLIASLTILSGSANFALLALLLPDLLGIDQGSEEYVIQNICLAGIGISQIINGIFTFRREKAWPWKKVVALQLAVIVFLTISLIVFFSNPPSFDEDAVVVVVVVVSLFVILTQIIISILVLLLYLFSPKVRLWLGRSNFSIRRLVNTDVKGVRMKILPFFSSRKKILLSIMVAMVFLNGLPLNSLILSDVLTIDASAQEGSGTENDDGGTEPLPIADAGRNQTVKEGDTVVLYGANSRGVDGRTIASYSWALISVPGSLSFTPLQIINLKPNNNAQNPTFTAPPATGNYTFQLVVTDDKGAVSDPAIVVVNVVDSMSFPPVNNAPPIAVASASPQNAKSREVVTLSANRSSDPDNGPQPLKYLWTDVSGSIVGIVLQPGNNASEPTFTAPPTLDSNLTLRFKLVVNDGQADSAPAYIDVTVSPHEVLPEDKEPPVIAVPDSSLRVNATGPSGALVEYQVQVSAIDDVDGPIDPICTPASGSTFQIGDTTVTCKATDSSGNTASQSFVIRVVQPQPQLPEDKPPTAVITLPSKPYRLDTPLTFSGENSSDSDGQIVEYVWNFGDGTTDNGVTVTHTYKESGRYTVKLEVTDNREAKSEDIEELIVLQKDERPEIKVPSSSLRVNATGPSGALVEYQVQVSAIDDVDGPIDPICTPASGSTFQIGDTTVTCKATDSSGNTASKSFHIAVLNNPPVITDPPTTPIEVPATSNEGAKVEYTVTALDIEDGKMIPRCDPPSGSIFRVGQTMVSCNIRDNAGSYASLDFPVIVRGSTDWQFFIIMLLAIAAAAVAVIIIILIIRRRRRMMSSTLVYYDNPDDEDDDDEDEKGTTEVYPDK
jgi:PKD repeat protein